MSIVEVAKAAGVSTATVSRVLNGLPGVRAETVAQVKAAVDELAYKPQRVRVPRKRTPRGAKLRTGNIAVITLGQGRSWLEWPVLASVVGGIQRATQGHDLRLILGEMPDVTKPSPLLTDRQIDGAIVFMSSEVPVLNYEATLKAMMKHVPIVWAMGMEIAAGGVDHVTSDNVGIGHAAYAHLARLGCKNLAFLHTYPDWPLIRMRGQAFLNGAFDGGQDATVYIVSNNARAAEPYGPRVVTAPTREELIQKFVNASPRHDGLFVANDQATSSIYPMLIEAGVKIGQDLQIISCDNEEARLAAMQPRPASIDIGAEEIGYRAVNRLLNRIERPNGPPLIIQVTPRIVLPK